jgi:hypothetical protein
MMHPSRSTQSAACRARRSRLRGAAGITLIDTLVALSLLLLSTGTIGSFLVSQIRSSSTNALYTHAYSIAAQELEDLRGTTYDKIDSRSSVVQEGTISYAIETTVLPDTPEPNMKDISVDVRWNEPGGAQHVQVQTIYTDVQR